MKKLSEFKLGNLKKINTESISKYMCLISVTLVVLIFFVINPKFLSLYSIQNMLLEMAPLLLLAGGITFVLFTGGIDLSAGAVASCTCVLTGLYIDNIGGWIVPLMIVLGVVIGLINGFLITAFKLPSFIVTLCATSIWKCIALISSGGGSKIIPLDKRYLVNWASAPLLGIPVMLWMTLAIIGLLYFIQRNTTVSKSILAVGANARAARMAGTNTVKAQITAMTICSVCSALAGVLYAFKMKSSVPNIGDPLGLMAIAAVALGGTSLAGGKGSVLNTIAGVATIIAVTSGMNIINVHALWKDIVIGVILIIAVFINSDKTGKDVIIK